MFKKPSAIIYLTVALTMTILLTFVYRASSPEVPFVSYTQFKKWAGAGQVSHVLFRDNLIEIDLTEPLVVTAAGGQSQKAQTNVPNLDDPALFPLLETHGVVIESHPVEEGSGSYLLAFLPWILILGVYYWLMRRSIGGLGGRMNNELGGRRPFDFLSGSAHSDTGVRSKVTFEDVAGQDSAKKEVVELVQFLQTPEMYRKLGAEPPRGVLLMGPPGTGKTLLARALAGEAGVPFFSISASEFIEMFVGVGASRVRAMFEEAKKRAPSIIFIDELDSIGRIRGTGLGGGHDEREQTLNQILSELDGFSGHEAVIVLAATNRPDVLDPALLRPGRFDRHVTLELPDRDARLAILKVHTRKVPLASDVDLSAIAASTPGFSGADLKNLANEAAMSAARRGANDANMNDLDSMRDKVMMGTVRTLAVQPDERHRLAVHEAGHTAVAHHLPNADPLYKVTIIPRGRSLGGTHMLPDRERYTLPEDYLRDRLVVMLGGRVAEKLLLGTVSSGADDDIREATKLARAMVSRWGMDEDIGPVDVRQSDDHPFLGREIAQPRHFSDGTAEKVDQAVQALLKDSEERANALLIKHLNAVKRLVETLEKRETLDSKEIRICLDGGADVIALKPDHAHGKPTDP